MLATHDGCLFDESYNLLNAWLSTVPGNGAHNLRRLALLETNAADLSFVFALDKGERVSPYLGEDALSIFETPHHAPYAFNLHVQDVGHTLVLGATGSGKSFLLNFIVTHAQKYEPLTVILDLGHSYRKFADLLDGRYLEVGLRQQGVSINPFALDPTPENLHFLHSFVRVLLEGADAYRLSDTEDRELYEAIENVYVLDTVRDRGLTLLMGSSADDPDRERALTDKFLAGITKDVDFCKKGTGEEVSQNTWVVDRGTDYMLGGFYLPDGFVVRIRRQ